MNCARHIIKIERPFFLRKKKQFLSAEAKKNVTVPRARVHVERANQRIRIFEIFNFILPTMEYGSLYRFHIYNCL
jgi:hypothetical protein